MVVVRQFLMVMCLYGTVPTTLFILEWTRSALSRRKYTSPFPGHASFATTCQDCHSTTAWRPASGGSHPQARFSITGTHSYACNECHNPSLGPDGAGNADCVGCHEGEHTLARMDGEHNGIGDYPRGANRAPNFCLQCHADGRE